MKIALQFLFIITNIIFGVDKLFIACEGQYYNGQGSVSVIKNLESISELSDLGNTVQSITVHNEILFIVVNGSSLIHIFEINENEEEYIQTINTNGSGPRNLIIHEELAYFTNWNTSDIKIMDLENYEIINTIPVDGLPEDIISDGNNLWVSIIMNEDWSDGNKVLKINPLTGNLTEFDVGFGPGELLYHNNAIYISRTYYDDYWNAYHATSKIYNNEIITAEYGAGLPCGGSITKHLNQIYRSYDGGIAPLDDELNILTEERIGNFDYSNVYNVESIDENIYFALTDWNHLNQIAITNEMGYEISRFDVGIIPTDFALWSQIDLGDMDENGQLNVLDVLIILDIILNNTNSDVEADLNEDGIINIEDIIILINIILDD